MSVSLPDFVRGVAVYIAVISYGGQLCGNLEKSTGAKAAFFGPDSNGGSGRRLVLGGKMQVEYIKEWMDTFLWILPDHPVEEAFEEKMIKYNPGEGRLDFSRQQRNGEDWFCYKVTGKKALNSIYAALPIGERQIRTILGQLFSALESAKEYLLSEEDFVLSPTFMFATLPRMDMEFCYMPGYGIPLREQLEGLFEYLLNRVDYEDKAAVDLLYDCYMFCMKEKGGLSEIRKLLARETAEEPPVAAPPNVQAEERQRKKIAVYTEPEERQEKKIPSGSYVSWLTDKIFPWKRRDVALVAEEKEEYRAEKQEAYAKTEERTVLLAEPPRPEGPELICEQTGETVPLTKFPFYIGSTREYADFVPAGEGVSRIHCCISKKGDNYYLSDLNSTNGTYLNGKEVVPGKDVLLSANDEIRIISQEFYMKFPCH